MGLHRSEQPGHAAADDKNIGRVIGIGDGVRLKLDSILGPGLDPEGCKRCGGPAHGKEITPGRHSGVVAFNHDAAPLCDSFGSGRAGRAPT